MKTEIELKSKIKESLKKLGWKFLERDEIMKSPKDIILEDLLIKKIKEINSDLEITDNDIKKVIEILLNSESHRKFIEYLKRGVTITLEKTKVKETIKLIDFEKIENNDFIFSEEVVFDSKKLDLVLFINGIPFVIIEVEREEKDKYYDALNQLNNYLKSLPNLFKLVSYVIIVADQNYIGIIDDKVLREGKIKEEDLMIWKTNPREITTEEIFNAIFSNQDAFLSKNVFLEILRYYTFFDKNKGKKILPRYYQYYTCRNAYQEVINYLNGKSKTRSGIIWHYQGSGKSYEIIFLASNFLQRIQKESNFSYPLVLVVVDRLELQNQIKEKFLSEANFEEETSFKVSVIENSEQIKELHPQQTGVFIVMIQKFREEIKDGSLKDKKDVLILIDEIHRSQYGILNERLLKLFNNAFIIGFTGTPKISKEEIDTFTKFGDPIEFIYFIDDIIRDKLVVDFQVIPKYNYLKQVIEKIEDLKSKIDFSDFEKTRESFFYTEIDDIEEEEGFLELRDEKVQNIIEEEIKRKILSYRKLIFENEKIIGKVCEEIKNIYENQTKHKGLKSLVIVPSKKSAIIFVRKLKQILGNEREVEAIMTYDLTHDSEEIINYFKDVQSKYGPAGDINEAIKEKFKKEEYPKILVVIGKLIQGFDFDKLHSIFIFRFLTSHSLLQAIGRCNRKHPNKEFGIIVDFVGIIDELRKAFQKYTEVRIKYEEFNNQFKRFLEDSLSLELLKRKIESCIFEIDSYFDLLSSEYNIKLSEKEKLTYENLVNKFIELFSKRKFDDAERFLSNLISQILLKLGENERIVYKLRNLFHKLLDLKISLIYIHREESEKDDLEIFLLKKLIEKLEIEKEEKEEISLPPKALEILKKLEEKAKEAVDIEKKYERFIPKEELEKILNNEKVNVEKILSEIRPSLENKILNPAIISYIRMAKSKDPTKKTIFEEIEKIFNERIERWNKRIEENIKEIEITLKNIFERYNEMINKEKEFGLKESWEKSIFFNDELRKVLNENELKELINIIRKLKAEKFEKMDFVKELKIKVFEFFYDIQKRKNIKENISELRKIVMEILKSSPEFEKWKEHI